MSRDELIDKAAETLDRALTAVPDERDALTRIALAYVTLSSCVTR